MTIVLTLTKQQTVFISLHFRKVKFHNTPVTLFKSFCTVLFELLKLCIILSIYCITITLMFPENVIMQQENLLHYHTSPQCMC